MGHFFIPVNSFILKSFINIVLTFKVSRISLIPFNRNIDWKGMELLQKQLILTRTWKCLLETIADTLSKSTSKSPLTVSEHSTHMGTKH